MQPVFDVGSWWLLWHTDPRLAPGKSAPYPLRHTKTLVHLANGRTQRGVPSFLDNSAEFMIPVTMVSCLVSAWDTEGLCGCGFLGRGLWLGSLAPRSGSHWRRHALCPSLKETKQVAEMHEELRELPSGFAGPREFPRRNTCPELLSS